MGVPMTEISNSLAVMFGSSYVGDFMHGSQVRRIIIQADGKSRLSGDDIEDLHVRNEAGSLLPLSSFVNLEWTAGPPQLTRYNNLSLLHHQRLRRSRQKQRGCHEDHGADCLLPASGDRL